MVSETESLALRKYTALFDVFASGRISGEDFYTVFFPMYAEEPTNWSSEAYEVLQHAFWAAEDFTPERAGGTGYPTEMEFRAEIAKVLNELKALT